MSCINICLEIPCFINGNYKYMNNSSLAIPTSRALYYDGNDFKRYISTAYKFVILIVKMQNSATLKPSYRGCQWSPSSDVISSGSASAGSPTLASFTVFTIEFSFLWCISSVGWYQHGRPSLEALSPSM